MSKFSIWKTVRIGTFKSLEKLYDAIPTSFSIDMLTTYNYFFDGCFTLSPKEEVINLAMIKVKSLGLRGDNIKYEEICKKARKLGLILCPQDTGPMICLRTDPSQIKRDLIVASKTFTGGPEPEFDELVFNITLKDKKVHLKGLNVRMSTFNEKSVFVFVEK